MILDHCNLTANPYTNYNEVFIKPNGFDTSFSAKQMTPSSFHQRVTCHTMI